jgi:hypothetical protein
MGGKNADKPKASALGPKRSFFRHLPFTIFPLPFVPALDTAHNQSVTI